MKNILSIRTHTATQIGPLGSSIHAEKNKAKLTLIEAPAGIGVEICFSGVMRYFFVPMGIVCHIEFYPAPKVVNAQPVEAEVVAPRPVEVIEDAVFVPAHEEVLDSEEAVGYVPPVSVEEPAPEEAPAVEEESVAEEPKVDLTPKKGKKRR